ncbi:PHD-finger family protein, putative [Ichthyophthirius multifiliis]|uniref:PHD-finger family protein, putative n=1 Tax=Ichthyophthirius multifiliis TaxID=5932 RepID=G0R1B0_ICHMU|nr:PHD-finger family protein, putative [Ichthyophthirius multifiliis]EGR28743.1 PHD-finger family protein, putative [Ichthyophthirius multifiliis]|eukprot:XP_004029979.1 PHD-finger family protein, putative [Ichthyophthirius multifiliis]
MRQEIANEKQIYKKSDFNFDDPLVDIYCFNQFDKQYLNYLQKKQQYNFTLNINKSNNNINNTKINISIKHENSSKTKQNNPVLNEDIPCQICNDKDFADDDLIVFCSKCNISVHQRCYGILKIPNDDWICELCVNFGPQGQLMRCPLCPKRGGALKPSKIQINLNTFENINPSYHLFASQCTFNEANKYKYEKIETEDDINKDENNFYLYQQQQQKDYKEKDGLYYDFTITKDQEVNLNILNNEPKPNYVWCHISCTLWTPECYFDDRNYYNFVKGIENIDKSRFKLLCKVCKLRDAGSCIKCSKGNCEEAFHSECARRANICLEVKNSERLQYLLYCELHTPLQIIRFIENKEKKYKVYLFIYIYIIFQQYIYIRKKF